MKRYILFFLLILGVGAIIFYDYLVFNKIFVFDGFSVDSITQFIPFYYWWIDRLLVGDFSLWSFQVGLGSGVYHILANLNPFDLLLLIFGRMGFVDALGFITLLKFLVAGLFSYSFLLQLRVNQAAAFVSALCFTFSGYMVINSHWYHYPNYAVFAALFLFLLERWFSTGRWFVLLLVIGFLPLKGHLQYFQLAFFSAAYIFLRLPMFSCKKENIFKSGISYLTVYIKFGFIYGTGMLLNSFMLLPYLSHILESGRGGGSAEKILSGSALLHFFQFADSETIATITSRFISNDLLGSFSYYDGVLNYFEGPSVYIGLLPLIVVPVFLFKKIFARKWVYPLFFLAIISPLYFPVFREFTNGMASGTFKYITLYTGIGLTVLSALALEDLFTSGKKTGIFTGCFSLFLCIIFVSQYVELPLPPSSIVIVPLVFFMIYGLVFIFSQLFKGRLRFEWVIVAVVVGEIIVAGRITMSSVEDDMEPGFIERHESFFDRDVADALQAVSIKDNEFFRVERNFYSGSLNDSLIQGYYGTTGYYGFEGNGVIEFYGSLGLAREKRRLASYRFGLSDRISLHSLLGVRYFLSGEGLKPPPGYVFKKEFGTVTLYENPDWLPIGSLYTSMIARKDFNVLSDTEKDRTLIHSFVADQEYESVPVYKNLGETTTLKNVFSLELFKEDRIVGTVKTADAGMLFFPIPYDRGWEVKIKGKVVPVEKINFGFIGVEVGAGEYSLEMNYFPRYLLAGCWISLITLFLVIMFYRRKPVIFPSKRIQLFAATEKTSAP